MYSGRDSAQILPPSYTLGESRQVRGGGESFTMRPCKNGSKRSTARPSCILRGCVLPIAMIAGRGIASPTPSTLTSRRAYSPLSRLSCVTVSLRGCSSNGSTFPSCKPYSRPACGNTARSKLCASSILTRGRAYVLCACGGWTKRALESSTYGR